MNRPKRPSANQTRLNIIRSAKEHFLSKGYDGTSIASIAKGAGVNTNLIFHHFNNKETLWLNVKKDILSGQKLVWHADVTSARAYFKSILDFRFDLYDNHPDWVRLIQWQQLTENESALIDDDSSSPNQWLKTIKMFQRKGEIKKNIAPENILLFIVFSTHAPFMQKIIPLSKKKKEYYKSMLLAMAYDQFLTSGN